MSCCGICVQVHVNGFQFASCGVQPLLPELSAYTVISAVITHQSNDGLSEFNDLGFIQTS